MSIGLYMRQSTRLGALFVCMLLSFGVSARAQEIVNDAQLGAESTISLFFDQLTNQDIQQTMSRPLINRYFESAEEVDAFVIYVVSRMRAAGFDREVIRSYDIEELDVDADYGFVNASIRISGRWWFFIPTSALLEVRLRLIDDRWHLLAPPLTNLDEFVN